MEARKTDRGFIVIEHPAYPNGNIEKLVQESSAIGEDKDSLENPGSSFLFVGRDFHLNREEVGQLVILLLTWLSTKRLPMETDDKINILRRIDKKEEKR